MNRNTILNASNFSTSIPIKNINLMNYPRRTLKTTLSYKRIVDKSPLSKSIPDFSQQPIKYPEYSFGPSSLLKKGRTMTQNNNLSLQKSKDKNSFNQQVIRISSGNKTHLKTSKYNAWPQTNFKKYSTKVQKIQIKKMQNSSNSNNTKSMNNLAQPYVSFYAQKENEDKILSSLKSIESLKGKNLNSFINKKNIEDSNVIVKVSNERRRELLFEAYQSSSILIDLIRQSIQALKEKKRINLIIKSYSKGQLISNSPYNFINIKKRIKRIKKKEIIDNYDELAASISKNLNEELDEIWKNVVSSKKPGNSIQNSLKKCENDIEEKDKVNYLKPPIQNSKIPENSSIYEASFLRSCATKSLNLINQASLKINLVKQDKDSINGSDSNDFLKDLEKSNLNSESKVEEGQYENLIEEMGVVLKWKPGDIIGAGKFGQVLKCLDSSTGKFFAAKRIQIGSMNLKEKEKQLSDLNREIKILKSLQHANIVQYLESEILGNEFYIYMEYVSGGSIKSLMNKFGPLDEKTIKVYAKQILEGLAFLHSNKIIHMDIKAANILVTSDGKVKLSDFGCSANLDFMKNHKEIMETIRGSLPWMAPEVINEMAYSLKSDIWSLGCTIIEMATNKTPWGEFDNMMNAIYFISKSSKIPTLPENLSEDGKFFIKECLNRNISERPNVLELMDFPFITNP